MLWAPSPPIGTGFSAAAPAPVKFYWSAPPPKASLTLPPAFILHHNMSSSLLSICYVPTQHPCRSILGAENPVTDLVSSLTELTV